MDERKIRSYRTDQYAEALAKGSLHGGVAAILDEIPYLKLFMSKQCGNHSIISRVYKIGGFGFVSYNYCASIVYVLFTTPKTYIATIIIGYFKTGIITVVCSHE